MSSISAVNPAILEYLTDQQCARQWKGFLQAFAGEFAARLPEADLHGLMHRIGVRFAQAVPLGATRSLDDIQLAMGRVWVEMDWGWTVLSEQDDHLRIVHHCAPLRAAFGPDAARWSAGFLEGVYQQWFVQADAGALQVRQSGESDAAGSLVFRLASADE